MKRRQLPPTPPTAPRKRSRGGLPWGKLFLLSLLGLGALAWFAPTIVVKSSLRDRLLGMAVKDVPGKVSIGSASAGWLSAIEVSKASVTDSQGQEIMSAASIRTEKSLYSLLMDRQQLGKIRIEQPKLKLVLRPDGSNVEDLLKPVLGGEKSSASTGLAIEIIDGTVEATYAGSDAKWQLDKFNANVTIPAEKTAATTARIKTNLAAAGSPPGTLAADVQWQPAAKSAGAKGIAALGQGTVAIQSDGLPLELVTVALRSAGWDVQLAGSLTADAALTFTDKSQTIKIQQLAGQKLFIAAPPWLGADQVQLATLSGSGEVSRGNNEWQFRNVSLQSDVAQLTATGAGPIGGADSLPAELTRAFRAGNWEVRGNLDVAKLAAMLPTTLRLREGTHVSSGKLAIVGSPGTELEFAL